MRDVADLYQGILQMRAYVPQLDGQAAQFRAMIEGNPDEPVFYYELGNTYMAMGDLRSATSAYDDLIEVCEGIGESYDWGLLTKIAKNYEKLNEPSMGIKYLEKYLGLVPNHTGVMAKLEKLRADLGKG